VAAKAKQHQQRPFLFLPSCCCLIQAHSAWKCNGLNADQCFSNERFIAIVVNDFEPKANLRHA